MGDFYSFEEMAAFLKLKPRCLLNRIYLKKRVPPFVSPSRGVYWFPKKAFEAWMKEQTVRSIA